MHDAATIEGHGIPTAAIVTTSFVEEARLQCIALGMDDLRPVVIQHPLSTLTESQIVERAQEAVPQIHRILLAS